MIDCQRREISVEHIEALHNIYPGYEVFRYRKAQFNLLVDFLFISILYHESLERV